MKRKNELNKTQGHLPVGTHICQVFSDDQERVELFENFVLAGLANHEKIACFSDELKQELLEQLATQAGCETREGQLSLQKSSDVYFSADQTFNMNGMLDALRSFHYQAKEEGYGCGRVIGEMTPNVKKAKNGDQLLEYEARVSLLFRQYPLTAICQYDARNFDGDTIMHVLKLHPMMIVRGQAVKNPFFIQPDEYLRSIGKDG